MIVFCVPKNMISKAVGENGKNAKTVSGILGKRIKIIPKPDGLNNIKSFIESIVSPLTFKELEIKIAGLCNAKCQSSSNLAMNGVAFLHARAPEDESRFPFLERLKRGSFLRRQKPRSKSRQLLKVFGCLATADINGPCSITHAGLQSVLSCIFAE